MKQLGLFWADRLDRSEKPVRPVAPKTETMAPIAICYQEMIKNNFYEIRNNPRIDCVEHFAQNHDLGFHWADLSDRSVRPVRPVG